MKMSYELFKQMVTYKVFNYLPEQFQNYKPLVTTVYKTNRALDGFTLCNPEQPETNIAPVMYLNDFWEKYNITGNMSAIFEEIANNLAIGLEESKKIDSNITTEAYIKEHVVLRIINAKMNEELLQQIPHICYLDLAIIFVCLIASEGKETVSFVIRNSISDTIGLSTSDLYGMAKKNTKSLLPTVVKSMNDALSGLLAMNSQEEEFELFDDSASRSPAMYILSNKLGNYGAAAILDNEALFRLSKQLNDDLYVIPSSIHEIIAVPCSIGASHELKEVIFEVNRAEVKEEERLSDNLYYYDRITKKLSICMI